MDRMDMIAVQTTVTTTKAGTDAAFITTSRRRWRSISWI
jgi:hypothetical protein